MNVLHLFRRSENKTRDHLLFLTFHEHLLLELPMNSNQKWNIQVITSLAQLDLPPFSINHELETKNGMINEVSISKNNLIHGEDYNQKII